MVLELTWEEDIVQLQNLGILFFGSLSTIHQQKYASMTLHWRAHGSIKAEFDSEHFQFLVREIRACYRRGILSDPGIGFLSSSKLKFRDLGRYFWLGETPGKSNPSLTPGLKNPKISKLIVLVDSLYLEIGEGSSAKNFTRKTSPLSLPGRN